MTEYILMGACIALGACLMWAYRRGFQDGLKISMLRDEKNPRAVDAAMRPPVKPQKLDKGTEKVIREENRKRNILIANVGSYNGTKEGQKDVV